MFYFDSQCVTNCDKKCHIEVRNLGSRSSKLTDFDTKRTHSSNLGPILHSLGDTAT